PEDVRSKVEWLLTNNVFLYDGLDIENRKFDKQQPFMHSIIKNIILTQWFGKKGDGVKCVTGFKGMPNALLALVATAVECTLCGYLKEANLTYLDEVCEVDEDFGLDFDTLEEGAEGEQGEQGEQGE
ncbi:hypothetical protein HYDPIDRAFT_104219, partial [Hydnomerulius pinastri MD-312]